MTIEEAAIWVVDLFDQANTNHAIQNLGSRGNILFDAINDLRRALNKNGKMTALTEEQVK